jgi:hypothetical protein
MSSQSLEGTIYVPDSLIVPSTGTLTVSSGASSNVLYPTSITVAAATTLTAGQSGSLINVSQAGAYQITLLL